MLLRWRISFIAKRFDIIGILGNGANFHDREYDEVKTWICCFEKWAKETIVQSVEYSNSYFRKISWASPHQSGIARLVILLISLCPFCGAFCKRPCCLDGVRSRSQMAISVRPLPIPKNTETIHCCVRSSVLHNSIGTLFGPDKIFVTEIGWDRSSQCRPQVIRADISRKNCLPLHTRHSWDVLIKSISVCRRSMLERAEFFSTSWPLCLQSLVDR